MQILQTMTSKILRILYIDLIILQCARQHVDCNAQNAVACQAFGALQTSPLYDTYQAIHFGSHAARVSNTDLLPTNIVSQHVSYFAKQIIIAHESRGELLMIFDCFLSYNYFYMISKLHIATLYRNAILLALNFVRLAS